MEISDSMVGMWLAMPGIGQATEGMGLATVTVTLDDQEVVHLEAILMDRDSNAALEYLERVLMQKLEHQRKSRCGPSF